MQTDHHVAEYSLNDFSVRSIYTGGERQLVRNVKSLCSVCSSCDVHRPVTVRRHGKFTSPHATDFTVFVLFSLPLHRIKCENNKGKTRTIDASFPLVFSLHMFVNTTCVSIGNIQIIEYSSE